MCNNGDGCCTPHGRMSALAVFLSIVCSIGSYFATRSCSYVQIDGRLLDLAPYSEVSQEGEGKYGIGFFRHEAYTFFFFGTAGTCTSYSSDMIDNASYFDGAFKASRAFAIMASVSIGIGLFFLMISYCVEFPPKATKFLGGLFGAGSLFQLLTFTLFASSVCEEFSSSCELSRGAYFAIISTIITLFTAVVVCMIPPTNDTTFDGVPPPALAIPKGGTTTVTETVMSDGTKTITEITVNADGSKTVSESVFQPTTIQ